MGWACARRQPAGLAGAPPAARWRCPLTGGRTACSDDRTEHGRACFWRSPAHAVGRCRLPRPGPPADCPGARSATAAVCAGLRARCGASAGLSGISSAPAWLARTACRFWCHLHRGPCGAWGRCSPACRQSTPRQGGACGPARDGFNAPNIGCPYATFFIAIPVMPESAGCRWECSLRSPWPGRGTPGPCPHAGGDGGVYASLRERHAARAWGAELWGPCVGGWGRQVLVLGDGGPCQV